jgi:hypothetical protein
MNFSLNSAAFERDGQGRIGLANSAPTPAELLGVGAVEPRKPEPAEDLTGQEKHVELSEASHPEPARGETCP